MESLMQTLLAFVGTMLVFALAAQSLQEVLKTMLVVKGRAMQKAMEGLVREATRNNKQWTIDADAIIRQLVRRLGSLGQDGVFKGKIRLDSLPAPQLEDLIKNVEPADVPGLPGDRKQAETILAEIGQKVKDWYPIAVAPVDDRYRRRMRLLALLSSALVVLPFNLDAIRVYRLAATNPEFRARAVQLAIRMDSLYRATSDSTATPVNSGGAGAAAPIGGDSTADSGAGAPRAARPDSTGVPADSIRAAFDLSADDARELRRVFSEDLLGRFRLENLKEPRWWFGILLSIALVSLGAPFWHDLLESVFGLKNRLLTSAEDDDSKKAGKAQAGK